MGGFPAARITDQSAHGGTVVVGYPTVIIGKMPASRIGDNHVCPMATGPVPHVGGPFILGSFTVLVGGMPQSRVTDMLVCVGPPDTLIKGEPTVLVGMVGGMGFMAMLKGLMMAGLAVIKQTMGGGFPRAEIRPGADPPYATQYSKAIQIQGSPEYQAKVIRDLNKIAGTPSGQRLLDSLDASGKSVTIHFTNPDDDWAWTTPPPAGSPPWPGYKGGGPANTEVGFDPDSNEIKDPPYNNHAWAQAPNSSSDVYLYHELTHCDDMAHGELDNSTGTNFGPRAGDDVPNYELRAVGLSPYDKEPISENAYRKDQNLLPRTFY